VAGRRSSADSVAGFVIRLFGLLAISCAQSPLLWLPAAAGFTSGVGLLAAICPLPVRICVGALFRSRCLHGVGSQINGGRLWRKLGCARYLASHLNGLACASTGFISVLKQMLLPSGCGIAQNGLGCPVDLDLEVGRRCDFTIQWFPLALPLDGKRQFFAAPNPATLGRYRQLPNPGIQPRQVSRGFSP